MNDKLDETDAIALIHYRREIINQYETDPLFRTHWLRKVNRRNLKRWGTYLAIITAALFAWFGYLVISERSSRRAQVDQEIRSLACAIVAPYPDSAAELILDLRAKYHCPLFIQPSPSPSQTPSAGDKHLPTPSTPRPTPGTGTPPGAVQSSTPSSQRPGGRSTTPPISARPSPKPTPKPKPPPTNQTIKQLQRDIAKLQKLLKQLPAEIPLPTSLPTIIHLAEQS